MARATAATEVSPLDTTSAWRHTKACCVEVLGTHEVMPVSSTFRAAMMQYLSLILTPQRAICGPPSVPLAGLSCERAPLAVRFERSGVFEQFCELAPRLGQGNAGGFAPLVAGALARLPDVPHWGCQGQRSTLGRKPQGQAPMESYGGEWPMVVLCLRNGSKLGSNRFALVSYRTLARLSTPSLRRGRGARMGVRT